MSKRTCHACAAAALGLAAVLAAATPVRAAAPADAPTPADATAPVGATAPAGARAPVGPAAPATAAPSEDIRDIRGPKNISPQWLVPAILAAATVLAIGGYAAWRWKRRRPLPRALRPFEIALQRLDDIRRLLDPASVREFSIAISDIVRQYIEAEFKVTATHRTTEEFLHDLLGSSQSSLAAHRNLLAHFLQQCDTAKFAGVSLSRQIMESLHQSARGFVIETSKPAPAAETHEVPELSRVEEAHDSLPST